MTSDMDHSQVLAKVLKADMQNIRATMDEIDIRVFEAAIDKILQARQIYVLGLRASAPLAQFLAHYLKYIFPNVTLVTSGISDVFEQLMRINDEDLLIGISFPRYTSRTLEAMELAKNRGASLLAITDGPLSPLHSVARNRGRYKSPEWAKSVVRHQPERIAPAVRRSLSRQRSWRY